MNGNDVLFGLQKNTLVYNSCSIGDSCININRGIYLWQTKEENRSEKKENIKIKTDLLYGSRN